MRFFKKYRGNRGIFQSFWHGGKLTPLAWLSLSSFVKEGHDFELYCYEPLDVPAGVQLKAADQIITMDKIFAAHGSYAPFSDLFRFTLLQQNGGWWTDTDVICTGKAIPKGEFVFAEERRGRINNAILKIPKNNELSDSILSKFAELNMEECDFGETGPPLLTTCVKIHDLYNFCVPTSTFYPLTWLEAYKFILPEFTKNVTDKIAVSPFVHIWNYMFRDFGFDTANHGPPKGSFLDVQYRQHCVYDYYDLQEVDQLYLRKQINAYIRSDWVGEWASEYGIEVPGV